jgi:hypothetical protein
MNKIAAAAVGIAMLASPAFAGDWRHDGCRGCGPQGWYGRLPNGQYGPLDGYRYVGGELPPPQKPPVVVTPSHCARPVWDTQSKSWRVPSRVGAAVER